MSPLTINPSRSPTTRRAGDAPLARSGKQNGAAITQHMDQSGAAKLFRASSSRGPPRSDYRVAVWRRERCRGGHEEKTIEVSRNRPGQPVQLPVRLRVEVTYVGPDPLLDDERLLVGLDPTRRRRGCSAGPSQRFRQEGREQDGAAGLEQGLFQDALQLPNVARPRVAAQPLQSLGGDLADLPPEFAVEAAQVVLHQHQQVIVPLPQWGQVDGEDAQAVIQVRAKLPLLRPRLLVAVRRRDQPESTAS